MAPIRVGFIGLSKPAPDSVISGAWAQIAHLPGLLAQPDLYQITALCNSSVEAARASIAAHKLSLSTKAYDDPTALANDPDVDLIVVSVFIGKHYMLAKPALEAGKMVYVEAPLAASVAEAEELAALAKAKGVRTMVGTQGRSNVGVSKIRELIKQGEIGEIVSSSVQARMAGYASSGHFPVAAKFVFDLESPGNSLSIGFNHFYDTHVQVLGPASTYHANIQYKGGLQGLVDSTNAVVEHVHPTSPDHINLQGTLASGALFSIAWRLSHFASAKMEPRVMREDLPDDHSHFRWIITGTAGEIEITTPDLRWQMAGSSVRLWLTKEGEGRREVELQREFGEGMSVIAENTAAQYKAFARGEKEKYADFEDAVPAARFVEELRGVARSQAGT